MSDKKQRNHLEIWYWMRRHGHTFTSIAAGLGYATHTPVWLTIHGHKNLKKVLKYLRDQGCPEKHLALPKGMEANDGNQL